jgi:MFS family permease
VSLVRQAGGVAIVLRVVFRNPELRRAQLALAAFNSAEWAVWVAMLVYAYNRGGASMAGIVALIQLVPATIFAPFASVLADRYRPALVLKAGYLAQAAGMGVTAAVLLSGSPAWLAYICAAFASTALTVTRPTEAALTPGLVRVPEELTASNVVSAWNESLSILVAPALAGVLLAVSGPGWVFLSMGALVFAGAVAVAPIAGPAAPVRSGAGVRAELTEGFRVVVREPAARTLVGLLGTQYVALGVLDVLYVVLAIDVLGMGDGGAGYLNAAFGAGGAVGIGVTASLVGRPRLMPAVLLSLAVWAASFVAMTVLSTAVAALLLLAVAGAARSLFDVAGRTLLQRTAPPDVVARVFGVLEALMGAGTAVGALLTPVLVGVSGSTAAIVGAGAIMPVLALALGRRLFAIDASARVPIVEIGLLRSLPLFGSLPPPEIEGLARSLVPVAAAAGDEIVTQGRDGDRYFAIAEGELEVVKDGARVRVLSRGEGFGEIALLHDVPRTATVAAITPVRLYALEKDVFLEVITGHPVASASAHAIAAERLAPAEG